MDDPSALLNSEFGTGVAANFVTVLGIGLLIGLKALCQRDSRCKSHIHCPCIDVEVADRTQRADHAPSVSEDDSAQPTGANRV